MKNIGILGASGSIGVQTVDVLRNNPNDFRLVAIAVGKNIAYANDLLEEFPSIEIVSVQKEEDIEEINHANVHFGEQGLIEVAEFSKVDMLVTAVVGSIGLPPTVAAIQKKKTIGLANKETLVTAGKLIMDLATENNVDIFPIDSEHSAIFQCLNGERKQDVSKLIITASGGSFRDKELSELEEVNIHDALQHPNWSMGAKITIDSATMANKALEVIEAHYLFDIPYDKIEALVQRESVIHSMVQFVDGSVIAQMGTADMREPIQYALTYPKRKKVVGSSEIDFLELGELHFQKIDSKKYPMFFLGVEAGKSGGLLPTVFNAANEEAVELFLEGKISYLEIYDVVKRVIDDYENVVNPSLAEIQKVDTIVREKIKEVLK